MVSVEWISLYAIKKGKRGTRNRDGVSNNIWLVTTQEKKYTSPLNNSYHFLCHPKFRNWFLSPKTARFISRVGTVGTQQQASWHSRKTQSWVQTQRGRASCLLANLDEIPAKETIQQQASTEKLQANLNTRIGHQRDSVRFILCYHMKT